MSGVKDRYVEPVIEMPEPENIIFRNNITKRELFNTSKSAESSPSDAFTGDIHTAYESKKTLAETITMKQLLSNESSNSNILLQNDWSKHGAKQILEKL